MQEEVAKERAPMLKQLRSLPRVAKYIVLAIALASFTANAEFGSKGGSHKGGKGGGGGGGGGGGSLMWGGKGSPINPMFLQTMLATGMVNNAVNAMSTQLLGQQERADVQTSLNNLGRSVTVLQTAAASQGLNKADVQLIGSKLAEGVKSAGGSYGSVGSGSGTTSFQSENGDMTNYINETNIYYNIIAPTPPTPTPDPSTSSQSKTTDMSMMSASMANNNVNPNTKTGTGGTSGSSGSRVTSNGNNSSNSKNASPFFLGISRLVTTALQPDDPGLRPASPDSLETLRSEFIRNKSTATPGKNVEDNGDDGKDSKVSDDNAKLMALLTATDEEIAKSLNGKSRVKRGIRGMKIARDFAAAPTGKTAKKKGLRGVYAQLGAVPGMVGVWLDAVARSFSGDAMVDIGGSQYVVPVFWKWLIPLALLALLVAIIHKSYVWPVPQMEKGQARKAEPVQAMHQAELTRETLPSTIRRASRPMASASAPRKETSEGQVPAVNRSLERDTYYVMFDLDGAIWVLIRTDKDAKPSDPLGEVCAGSVVTGRALGSGGRDQRFELNEKGKWVPTQKVENFIVRFYKTL